MHPLLKRQIRRYLEDGYQLPDEFLSAISMAYEQSDKDRKMVENSLELMSQELTTQNSELQSQIHSHKEMIKYIHEREDELAFSERRLKDSQRFANIGALDLDIHSAELYWSEQAHLIFGLDDSDVQTNYQHFMDALHPDDRDTVIDAIQTCVLQNVPFDIEHKIVMPNGKTKWVRVSGGVVRDEKGSATRMRGILQDITRLKEAEKKLEEEKREQEILIEKLGHANAQLLQAEKMASIGQLAAGVAHEINNPVGYISSNLTSMSHYLDDLLKVIEIYEQSEDSIKDDNLIHIIQTVKKEIDLKFLRQDLRQLLIESKEGVTRVKQIVQDLKDFSHVDEAEWQWADIHQGIDSTLNIVRNEIKYKAEVVKDFSDLPRVECIISQLNQVFMNLLVNAAHAIVDRGTIHVRTGRSNNYVWIEIADNGEGMDEITQNKIFDPFFTTKPVGKGTGLGLSLSYGIIQKHNGEIKVESEKGKGTAFVIKLPIEQSNKMAAC